MTVRYLTVDSFARIHEVTNLRDHFNHPTFEPGLAETCVVHYEGRAYATTVDNDTPVYTVH
jgi:hypothetical protein